MPLRHPRLALSGALLSFGLVSIVAAATPVAGEKWRMTSSSANGVPAQTYEMCLPKRESANQGPPAPQAQKNCKMTTTQRSATRQSMHMRCDTNGQVTESDIEMESLGPDHYRTTLHMPMAGSTVNVVTESQKIDGSCDASVPAAPSAAAQPRATGSGSSAETPPWEKPGAMEAEKEEARQRAEAESAPAPKEDAKDKIKSRLRGLIGF